VPVLSSAPGGIRTCTQPGIGRQL